MRIASIRAMVSTPRRPSRGASRVRTTVAAAARVVGLALGLCGGVSAAEGPPTIQRLLAEGWEIVGLAGNYDVRTSLILFRKKDVDYLVQCSTLFDVTRERRVVVNCYELR